MNENEQYAMSPGEKTDMPAMTPMKKDKTRLIIGVLAVALIIMTVMWANSRRTLADVLDRLEESTTDFQAQIEAECGPDFGPAEVEANPGCRAVLERFASMLQRYDRLLDAEVAEQAGQQANQ